MGDKVGFLQLFKYARGFDYVLIFLGTISAMANGATLPVMTIFFGDIIQAVVVYDSRIPFAKVALDSAVKDGVIKMCIVGAITFLVSYIQMACWMIAGESQAKRIRESYFRSVIRQEVAWFDKTSTGDLTNRLTADMNLIQDGLSDKIGLLIQFSSAFIAGFVIGYIKGWKLALVVTASLPFLSGAAYFLSTLLSGGSQKAQDAYAGAGDVAQQVLSSIRTVYAFGGEEKEKLRYAKQLDIAEKIGLRNSYVNGSGIGFIQLFVFCTYGLAFWFGNTLIPGTMNTGEVLNVIFAIIIGAFSLGNASPHIAAVGNAAGAAAKIYETIERKSPIDPLAEDGVKPDKIVGNIRFEDIAFHYPSRADVSILEHYDLEIPAGKTIALVGSSGSGKSTIVKLIERFYDPVAGKVTLDGTDIKSLNVNWLRNQIGMVSQEPTLFDTTIKQNILYGLPHFEKLDDDSRMKKIEQACRQANCWDFIQQLPKGLETNVGESGGMLSGGQKQRIAIARAIIKNPPILLLDEATSALDTESERVVQAALDEASKNRTTVVIAHRLSTIQNADHIVVMEKGVIKESGTHKSLIELGKIYAGLVKTQSLKVKSEVKGESAGNLEETITDAAPVEDAISANSPKSANSPGVFALKVDGDEKKPKPEAKIDYGRLLKWNRQEYWIFVIASFGAMANGAAQPCFAILFSGMLTALGTDKANFYAVLFVVLAVVAFFVNFLQGLFKYAGEKAVRRLRYASFEALLRQEIGFFDEEGNSTGALMSKLAEDASLVPGLTGQTFGAVMQGIAGGLAGIIIALLACWQLALVIMGMVPLIAMAGLFQFQALVGFGDKTKKAYEEVSQRASEAISSIRTIMTITQEQHFVDRFNASILPPHKITISGAFVTSAAFGFSQCILHFCWALSLFYGAQLMKWDLYKSEEVLRAMFSIIFTAMAVGQVSNFAPDAAKAKVAALNIFALLDRVPAISTSLEGGEVREKAIGSGKLQKIKFAYPTRPTIQVLKGLNLEANPGKTVALVGKSGCGKSTVMGLLQRWYDPISGEVSFDDLSVSSWNLRKLRSFMAMVGQEPVLFNMSIRDNIAYGSLEANPTDHSIYEAAKLANIHEFVMSLPKKYDTMVGEKGGQLSGGQKQRIAIARALIRNPTLLLLDEATSALDSESEHVVQAALDDAAKGRTTIVIAHRLSTIQNADLILVVDNGVVSEMGTHFELIEKKGIYFELVNQQKLTKDQ